jgi:hypothetical protein
MKLVRCRLRRRTLLQQLFFAIDERIYVVCSQLKPMPMRDRVGRASFHAIPAKNAARIIDVIDAGVTLARRNSICVGILGGFDVDAIGGACRGAQKTSDTLLEPRLIAVQNVNPAVARLKMHRLVRIVLRHGLAEHVFEGNAEALHQRAEGFADFSQNRWHGRSLAEAFYGGKPLHRNTHRGDGQSCRRPARPSASEPEQSAFHGSARSQ